MKKNQPFQYRSPNLDDFGFFKVKETKISMLDQPHFLNNISVSTSKSCSGVIVACSFKKNELKNNDISSDYINEYPEILKAVKKRKAEFIAGRFCAKLAMKYLSATNNNCYYLPIGKNREPIWPKPFAGSISHNNTTAISIVNLVKDKVSYGIDIEDFMSLETSENVFDHIMNSSEYGILYRRGIASNLATTVVYSAKESLFKCLHPIVKRYFGFESARLVDLDKNRLIFEMDKSLSFFNDLISRYVECQFTIGESNVISLCQIDLN